MYENDHIAQLTEMVRACLALWALPPDTNVALLTFSENATFLLTLPGTGLRRVLRVHRPGYHSTAEILSELAWIDALRRDRILRTPAPISGTDGRTLQAMHHGGIERQAVLFEHVAGNEPSTDSSLTFWFDKLGAITARMHLQARAWQRPAGFGRKIWDYDAALGPHAH